MKKLIRIILPILIISFGICIYFFSLDDKYEIEKETFGSLMSAYGTILAVITAIFLDQIKKLYFFTELSHKLIVDEHNYLISNNEISYNFKLQLTNRNYKVKIENLTLCYIEDVCKEDKIFIPDSYIAIDRNTPEINLKEYEIYNLFRFDIYLGHIGNLQTKITLNILSNHKVHFDYLKTPSFQCYFYIKSNTLDSMIYYKLTIESNQEELKKYLDKYQKIHLEFIEIQNKHDESQIEELKANKIKNEDFLKLIEYKFIRIND